MRPDLVGQSRELVELEWTFVDRWASTFLLPRAVWEATVHIVPDGFFYREYLSEARVRKLKGNLPVKTLLAFVPVTVVCLYLMSAVSAVELLTSGDFELPQGISDIRGWTTVENISGTDTPIDSVGLQQGTDGTVLLRAFAGGGPLRPANATGQRGGNFDDDNLPAGDVDGRDFLIWQRNFGLTGTALPEQGDANTDMNVNGLDLNIWATNFAQTPKMVDGGIFQSVPAVPGETYTFVGTSQFGENYSGFVDTLDAESPFGAIPSTTTTTFKMEFLDGSGNVIGTPTTLDLKTEQTFPGFPVIHSPLSAQAPAGTARVRISAEGKNMAFNIDPNQSAQLNDFTLTTATDPSTNLLENGDFNAPPPTALDFWDLSIDPEGCCGASESNPNGQLLRTPQANFANHTPLPSGTVGRGVWLSAFFGAHPNFNPDPVSATMVQTVDIVGGETYTFSGWTKFEGNYSGGVDTISATSSGFLAGMPSPTKTEISLEFVDINGVVLDSATIDVKAAREALCGGNANDTSCGPASNGWVQHSLQAIAPAGAVRARLIGRMIDGVFNTDPQQSAFFDDFSLEGLAPPMINAVPEPSSVVCLALASVLVGLRRGRQ